MDTLFGITGKDFVLTATSKAAVRGITVLKSDDDKSRTLNSHTLLLYSGEAGDSVNFAEFIQANLQLYEKRNDVELGSAASASFVRHELAQSLRSRKPYQTNLIVAGYDGEPHLYWIDYLASKARMPYAAQNYGAYYCQSIFDRYHRPDISLDEGLDILRKCFAELATRLPISFGGWDVKVIDKDGIRPIAV